MEERIIELLTRKFANEASDEELQELNQLLRRFPDSLYTEELFREVWNLKPQEKDVESYYKRHKRKHRNELTISHDDAAIVDLAEADKKKRNKYLTGSFYLLLVVSTAALLFFKLNKQSGKAANYVEIISGKGIRKSIKLPDGTNVWLNADSRLSYDANMNSNNDRTVNLSGEAFFDVVHNKDQPFIIHTNQVSVKVLGTAFDVKAYPGDKKCETTLIRGSIELVINGNANQKFVLNPSEKFSISNSKGNVSDAKAKTSDSSSVTIESITPVKLANKEYVTETSWIDNKLIFENESLEDLRPKLERWFNVKINITGKGSGAYKFTGAFTRETILQALTAMQLIKPFNFTIHDKNVTIY